MNNFKQIYSMAIVSMVLGHFSLPCRATSITGNPLTDGWIFQGNSASNANYNTGAAIYAADMYSTGFALAAGSSLINGLGGNWQVGDRIVGVGGVFNGTNTTLTYDGPNGATDTRFVVKYGTSSATWFTNNNGVPQLPASPGYGSLQNGGAGAVLLGTFAYDFSPLNTGTLILPASSPQEQTGPGPSDFTSINPNVGQIITKWSGSTVNGFESFLDLTLLKAAYPTTAILPGNKFILDLQDDHSEFQDSQGLLAVASAPVPDRASTFWLFAVALGLVGLVARRWSPKAAFSA